MVPQFDIDDKNPTRGDTQEKEAKFLELDFRKPFKRYDVLTELEIDPLLLLPENTADLDLRLKNDI